MIPKMTKTIIHMPPPRNLVCEGRAASDGPHGRSYLGAPSSFSPSAAGDSAGHRNGAVTHRLSRDRPWPRQIPIPRIRPTGLKAAFSGISVSWQYVGPLCGPKDSAVRISRNVYLYAQAEPSRPEIVHNLEAASFQRVRERQADCAQRSANAPLMLRAPSTVYSR